MRYALHLPQFLLGTCDDQSHSVLVGIKPTMCIPNQRGTKILAKANKHERSSCAQMEVAVARKRLEHAIVCLGRANIVCLVSDHRSKWHCHLPQTGQHGSERHVAQSSPSNNACRSDMFMCLGPLPKRVVSRACVTIWADAIILRHCLSWRDPMWAETIQ